MKRRTGITICLMLLLHGGLWGREHAVVVRAGEIHTLETGILEGGEILIKNGKIVEIGKKVRIPGGAEIINAENEILIPGFFASSSFLSSEEIRNYESFSPDLSALDGFDDYGDFSSLLAGGITSAYLGTAGDRLISGAGAVVKTVRVRQELPILKKFAGLTVNFVENALHPPPLAVFPAPISPDNPITPAFRQFPASALGAFHTVAELFRLPSYSGDMAPYMNNVTAALKDAKRRNIPLVVRCHQAADILLAIDLADLLDLPLIIVGGEEAHQVVDILKTRDVSVIVESPLRPNRTHPMGEELRLPSPVVPLLMNNGIRVALAPRSEESLQDLLWIALYHLRFGIPEEELIKTITLNPARMFGVDDRIGSLAEGKDADILFFRKKDGKPLPLLRRVMCQGRIVHEE